MYVFILQKTLFFLVSLLSTKFEIMHVFFHCRSTTSHIFILFSLQECCTSVWSYETHKIYFKHILILGGPLMFSKVDLSLLPENFTLSSLTCFHGLMLFYISKCFGLFSMLMGSSVRILSHFMHRLHLSLVTCWKVRLNILWRLRKFPN